MSFRRVLFEKGKALDDMTIFPFSAFKSHFALLQSGFLFMFEGSSC